MGIKQKSTTKTRRTQRKRRVKKNEIDYSDAVPFIGNNHDAVMEAERRANLWEDGKNELLAEITYESQGIL